MHFGLGDVITNGRNSKKPVFIAFLGDVPKAKLISSAEVIVRSDFVLIGFSSDALSCIPLISSNSHTKNMLRRELLLAKVGRESQFVFLAINEIVEIRLYKGSALYSIAMGLRVQHLLDLVVNGVLLDFAEAEVSWVNWPVVRPLLLLSWIIILVRLQVLQPHFFWLRHIFTRIDCLFHSIFVLLSCHSILELTALSLHWQTVTSIDCLSQWLSLQ